MDTVEKCGKLQPQSQGRPPGAWSILTGEVAVSKLIAPDIDMGLAVRTSSECGHELLMDLF
jgi:hypothetical protein